MTETLTCKDFVSQGWSDHAEDSDGVMNRFPAGIALVSESSDLPGLAGLITHVAGEHLGRWADGLALLERLTGHAVCEEGSSQAQSIARSQAVLRFCEGDLPAFEAALSGGQPADQPEASTRARVLAVATGALAGQERLSEAVATFNEALALVKEGVSPEDPVNRALAITSNNLACELEETLDRGAEQDELLELAALSARRFWEVAGTWNNVKVAEYRLAMTYLALGRAELALEHAGKALALAEANDAGPTDRLFVHEAFARAHHAQGEGEAASAHRDKMAGYLPDADPSWGDYPKETLAKVDALLAG
ncbi:MAG: hypothetical protein JKY65_23130 [Planctomycetes bacterium]|nr:hypothetical protein [Planctomycetota bacterium]